MTIGFLVQGWAISFTRELSSEVNQNEGSHDCTHTKFFISNLVSNLFCVNQFLLTLRIKRAAKKVGKGP